MNDTTWQAETVQNAHNAWQRKADELLHSLPCEEADALSFLYTALPFGDVVSCQPEFLLVLARHALKTRALTTWGNTIPDDIFRSFVLVPRVNNEPLEENRSVFFEELWPRVQNLSMRGAALEANYWCLEKATYQPTDSRTASPLTVVRRSYGRCGEESTLLVSVLRAIGIPARQCYVPRWAHCDDNHAWVEVWVDGTWHYMGACEPEPDLDIGWFTAAATRAMIIHTRGFGWQGDDESLLSREGFVSTINRTAGYTKTRTLTVSVLENNLPASGIEIRFELANMGELYPIHIQKTDENGQAKLETGLGCLHLHLHDGPRFMSYVVNVHETADIQIDFGLATEYGYGPSSFDMTPPAEGDVPDEAIGTGVLHLHKQRIQHCHAVRIAHEKSALKPQGNGKEINAFLLDNRFEAADKQALLETIRTKDWADITAETLADVLESALPWRGTVPKTIWREAVLAPRVEYEPLLPVRGFIRRYFKSRNIWFHSGGAVWTYITEKIEAVDDLASSIYTVADARNVLFSGKADARALDLLFINICRTFGIPARLNPVTGEKECYRDGGYYQLREAITGALARLTLVAGSEKALQYGVHFTIGRLENGIFDTLRLQGLTLQGSATLGLPSGVYRLLSCTRLIDGTVLAHSSHVLLSDGESLGIPVTLREGDLSEKLLSIPLEHEDIGALRALSGFQDTVWLFIAPGQEPTEHLLGELLALRECIAQMDIRLLLIVDEESVQSSTMLQLLDKVPQSRLVAWRSDRLKEYLRHALRTGDKRLPLIVIVRHDGIGLFAFANYNIGTGEAIMDVIKASRRMN